MALFKAFRRAAENLNRVLENPIVDQALDWAGDYFFSHMFLKERVGDKEVRKINPEWLRTQAPRLFAQTRLDENLLREITYSPYLDPAWRVELFDNWGPFPVVDDPDPDLGQVGLNQWNDIRLSLAEELAGLEGDARKEKIKDLGAFLTELAQLEPPYRLGRFVELGYCKPRENTYELRWFEHVRQRTFAGLADFRNWLTEPGPTGFRNVATLISAGIRTGRPITSAALNVASVALNTQAQRVNDRGVPRWFIR